MHQSPQSENMRYKVTNISIICFGNFLVKKVYVMRMGRVIYWEMRIYDARCINHHQAITCGTRRQTSVQYTFKIALSRRENIMRILRYAAMKSRKWRKVGVYLCLPNRVYYHEAQEVKKIAVDFCCIKNISFMQMRQKRACIYHVVDDCQCKHTWYVVLWPLVFYNKVIVNIKR